MYTFSNNFPFPFWNPVPSHSLVCFTNMDIETYKILLSILNNNITIPLEYLNLKNKGKMKSTSKVLTINNIDRHTSFYCISQTVFFKQIESS